MAEQWPHLPPQTPLAALTLAFVDVETTGLEPSYGDRICEVAVVRCAGRETLARYEQLINPLRPVSPGAFAVNGISDEMLCQAPTFAQVAEPIGALLEGAIPVGHNIAFDLGFFVAEFRRTGRPFAPPVALDTCKLARRNVLSQGYSLSRLSQHYGLASNGRAHRALADVDTTRALFDRLLTDLAGRGVHTLGQLLLAQGGPISYGQAPPLDVPPLIQDALRRQSLLQITYKDDGGRRTERLCRPCKLLTWEGRVTLVAHCYLRQAIRHFRLDRVQHIEMVELNDERAVRALESDAEVHRDARDP